MSHFHTEPCPANLLEPGDTYLWGAWPDGYQTREVLGIVTRGPLGSVLIEVRKNDGNVTRSYLNGNVARVTPDMPCRNCGDPFPYDPDADYCPACANEGDIGALLALAAAGNEQAREMLYDHHGINDEDRAAILAHQTRASIGW